MTESDTGCTGYTGPTGSSDTEITYSDILFTSVYIGDPSLLHVEPTFKKIKNARYLMFTNIEKKHIPDTSWEVITINNERLDELKKQTNNSGVRISRYFKFNVYSYLREYLNMDIRNKFIFYCDSYLYPKHDTDWINICTKMKCEDLKIVQYVHPSRSTLGINGDLTAISRGGKDIKENMNKTRTCLHNIDPAINLDTPQYYENTVLGFYSDEQVIQHCQNFWDLYAKTCPTYRDQPLWNFLYLLSNKRPYVHKRLRTCFAGGKKTELRIAEYTKNNL